MARSQSAKRRNHKQTLFIIQEGKCWLCGKPMLLEHGGRSPEHATFDHVLPVSQGGKDGIANLALAHKRCNEARGAQYELRAMRA